MPSRLLIASLVIGLGACADPSVDGTSSSDPELVEKIINGQFTHERPEVGSINMNGSFCTATLIRPNVLISAAHCIGYRTDDRPGQQLGVFTMDFDSGEKVRHAVDGYVSYTNWGPGTDDIALLRLRTPVPAETATPARLADARPADGTQVTWFGYGCGSRSGRDNQSGRKQKLAYALANTNNSCPGDSGGPTVVGDAGAIFRITSGYSNFGDIFGDVPAMYDTLQRQADTWWPDGESAPPQADPDVPEAPDAPQQSTRPTIREAAINKAWIYLEWTRVPAVATYTWFVVVNDGAGAVGAYAFGSGPGERTRADHRYVYVPIDEVCRAARDQGLAGPHDLWVQVWPEDDDARAENGAISRKLRCE